MHQQVIIGVDPAVTGMSRVADVLEANPFLPSRMALRQAIDKARSQREESKIGVVLSSNHPELAVLARLFGADRVALLHSEAVPLSAAQQPRLRAVFAAVDLCLVPDAAAERAAAQLGADPDRLAQLGPLAARRLFDEPRRKSLERAAIEMGASLALDAAERTGLIAALERLSPDRGVNIVNYHRVLPLPELVSYCRPQMAIAAPIFEAQLAQMADHFGFAPLEHIHDEDITGRVSVTFDDGYEDNLRVALPILQRFSTPACIFLVSNLIGRPDALWWDRVGMALFAWWKSGAAAPVPEALPARTHELAEAKHFEAARALISDILTDLNQVPEDTREVAVRAAERLVPSQEAAGRTMLSWEEVEALSAAGITFGAHTRNHVPLDELSRDEAVDELVGSQEDIEAHVGPVRYKTCALPRGRLGELTEDDLRAGFTSVMTTDAGVHDPKDTTLFVRRRDGRMLTLAGRHHPAKLRLEMSGWVDRLRAAVHARRGGPT